MKEQRIKSMRYYYRKFYAQAKLYVVVALMAIFTVACSSKNESDFDMADNSTISGKANDIKDSKNKTPEKDKDTPVDESKHGLVDSNVGAEEAEEALTVYSNDKFEQEEIIIENDNLEFHFDNMTTQFYIVKKSTGYTWYSYPQEEDANRLGGELSKYPKGVEATLAVKYLTESGIPQYMNNLWNSINRGDYTYVVLENGIKVSYTISDLPYCIPLAVPEPRFMEFLSKLDNSKQNKIKMFYKVYDINKPRKDENKDELLAKYPEYATEKICVLREGAQNYILKMLEEEFATLGYNQEEFEKDLARYDNIDLMDRPHFNISIQYTLEEDGLRVSIPMNEIQYKNKFPLLEISPLAYFGAENSANEGLIMIPDYNNTFITFNKGITTFKTCKVDSSMPVFGIRNKEEAFICILENGISNAYVDASVAGETNNYNYVSAYYNITQSESKDRTNIVDKLKLIFSDKQSKEVFSQKYIFLDDIDTYTIKDTYKNYMLQ